MSTVIVTECESEPLVPVTVITYAPIGVLCNALTFSVEVLCPPDVPRGRLRDDGLIEIEKSDTMTRIETECASDPLVPVTVTV